MSPLARRWFYRGSQAAIFQIRICILFSVLWEWNINRNPIPNPNDLFASISICFFQERLKKDKMI